MKRLKPFRRGFIAFLSVIFLLSAAIVSATVKLYTATAEDYANEVESQDIAKLRARDKAIKNATKQAGVYLKSYSRSVNSELTDDEVTAIASNAWELVGEPKYSRTVNQISDETTIIVWTATVEVNVDDSEIQSWIKRDEKDKIKIISQTQEAKKKSEENERQIEDLREKYNRATSQVERDRIIKQMNDADRDFLANQKFEEALKLYYAIKLNTEAIALKPDWSWPYNNRGLDYYNLGQYERAIQDFDKAIQLNPNLAGAYNNRGIAYRHLGQNERAVQDYDKALELMQHPFMYANRGEAYYYLKNYMQALKDLNKSLEFELKGKDLGEVLYYRALCYQALGETEKSQADFKKAKELGYNG